MFIDSTASFALVDIRKSATDSGEIGTFSGYASVFGNRDQDGDIVVAGAFPATIDPKSVKMLRQHKHADLIGIWNVIKPDEHGVFVKGTINLEVQLGRETYSLMRQGALDQMSVGMQVPKSGIEEKEIDVNGAKRRVRHIKSASLYEISLVTIASNPRARITDVKAAMPSESEFRRMIIATGCAGSNVDQVTKDYRALIGKMTPSDVVAADVRQALVDGFAPAIAEMFRRRT